MAINYSKVVDFILGDSVNKKGLTEVLKEIMQNYCMIDVDQQSKLVYLKSRKSRKDFILKRRDKGLMIIPSNSKSFTLADDFEEIIEIRVNDDNDVVLSSVTQYETPKGILVSGSNWHNEDGNTYTQVIGRIFFIDNEAIPSLNRQSIDMFIDQYASLRNDIFCDLYWDMNSLAKRTFIQMRNVMKVQINDGYTKEEFHALYERYKTKVKDSVKPKLF